MYSKKQITTSIDAYWTNLKLLKQLIDTADAILIGAGAGLSASAGLTYDGKRFYDHFLDFHQKYGLEDMYTAGFYPYETLEEYWAYWSRHIMLNRYQKEVKEPYHHLLSLIKDKNYFILTTNVDHCFQKTGFAKERLFYMQGDYGLWQCSRACHQKTYDNEEQVRAMFVEQKNMKIPTSLIPYCPHCHAPMTMNLRIDEKFVQDQGWYHAAENYNDFLNTYENKNILFWELGVGNNTPGIIKYPFWKMTLANKKAIYAWINNQEEVYPAQLRKQTVGICADLGKTLSDLRLC